MRLAHDPAPRPIGIALGSDVTGDDEPNAMVRTGAGGGFNGVIGLEIGERYRELARIDRMEGEIVVRDKPIRSWVTEHREMRMPFVVFAHDGQAYWVAGELMRWPPLGEGEWAAALGAMRAEVSAESRARPPTVLWRIVMELTYGGNMT